MDKQEPLAENKSPSNKRDLTTGSLQKHIMSMTLPMVIGIFAVIGFNVADTFFVAKLGTEVLAAISLTFPVVMSFGSLTMGLGVGVSSLIARASGEGDKEKVQIYTTHSLLLAILVVILFIVIGLSTIDPLFIALGANETTLPLVREYMQIWYMGILFLVVPMIGNGAIRAIGDARFPAMVMVLAGGVNLILDPILIFGYFGAPKLGLQGAAIATVISRVLTFIAAMWVLHFRENMLKWELPKPREVLSSWRAALHVGIPAAANQLIGPLSLGIVTSLLSVYGKTTIAGFGIATRIESLSMSGIFALSAGIGPIVGQNWGAGHYDRVRESASIGFRYSLIYGVSVALILGLFSPYLVPLFDKDPKVIQIALSYLIIVPISYATMGLFLLVNSTFNASGRPFAASVLTLLRAFVLYIPLALLGRYLFQERGIFIASCFANISVGILAYFWLKKSNCAVSFSRDDISA